MNTPGLEARPGSVDEALEECRLAIANEVFIYDAETTNTNEFYKKPTQYVCGFLFNTTGDYVVLIKRRESRVYRPGCWNGVGGHVEPGETPLQAMQREFKEEAGLEISDWKKFATLATDCGESLIHLFYSEQSTDMIYRVTTETDELVRPIALKSLPSLPRIPNLAFLISMAQSIRHCEVDMYHITEEGRRGF